MPGASYRENAVWWSSVCAKISHNGDVIMSVIASQITSLTIIHSTVNSVTDQRKHQSSTPLTIGEFPAQRASNAENVSIWWRHHVICLIIVRWTLHIHDVKWALSRKSLAFRLFVQIYQTNNKWSIRASHYMPFVNGTHRSPVDSPHKGGSNAENVPISWRHHIMRCTLPWFVPPSAPVPQRWHGRPAGIKQIVPDSTGT